MMILSIKAYGVNDIALWKVVLRIFLHVRIRNDDLYNTRICTFDNNAKDYNARLSTVLLHNLIKTKNKIDGIVDTVPRSLLSKESSLSMYNSSPDIIVKKIIILTIKVERFREDFYNGNTFFIIVRELLLTLSDQYSISILFLFLFLFYFSILFLNLEDCRDSWFFLQSLFYRENAN